MLVKWSEYTPASDVCVPDTLGHRVLFATSGAGLTLYTRVWEGTGVWSALLSMSFLWYLYEEHVIL